MDDSVAKINKIIGRLLGKNNNKKTKIPNKIDNEFVNMVIICLCFLLVWSLTGLYYVEDGYTAIIQNFGNKKKVVVGGSFGFSFPFPFTKIEKIYVNPIENVPLGSVDQNSYQLVTKNFEQLTFDGNFSYIVKSPLLLTNTLFINHDKLNAFVRMVVKSQLLSYSGYSFKNNSINFGIIATNVKQKVNKLIGVYGLELLMLNIKDVKLKEDIVNQISDESKLIDSYDTRRVEREVSR